jgi:hypothetical protein
LRNWLVSLWDAARHWPKKSTPKKSEQGKCKEKENRAENSRVALFFFIQSFV